MCYIGCDVVNASTALSLDLICEDCVESLIIVPYLVDHATSNITCRIDGKLASCISTTIVLPPFTFSSADSDLSLQCVGSNVCLNMKLNVMNANHIDIECNKYNPCLNMQVYAEYAKHAKYDELK